MTKKKEVVLRKSGNMLQVNPTDDTIFSILKPLLSFTSSDKLRGQEFYSAKKAGRSPWRTKSYTLMEIRLLRLLEITMRLLLVLLICL